MVFNKVWTVLNLSTESESTIRGWLSSAHIPACITLSFESPFNDMWSLVNAYGGTEPAPYAPWTIIVSSDEDARFNWTVYGLAWTWNKNCSIMFQPSNIYDTPAERGARMWHEMTHCMGMPADDMKTSEFAEFSQYLIDNGSPYQNFATSPNFYDDQSTPGHTELLTSFYTYLMDKYYPCECYGTQCLGDPCTSNQCLDTCAKQPCTTCPDQSGCTTIDNSYQERVKQVLILAGVGIGILALIK